MYGVFFPRAQKKNTHKFVPFVQSSATQCLWHKNSMHKNSMHKGTVPIQLTIVKVPGHPSHPGQLSLPIKGPDVAKPNQTDHPSMPCNFLLWPTGTG